ncbi:hypothetical protein W822_22600 [Advenella kashmirensis W13003]|uniref:CAP-Gly protein n=1 Tax=Advenella kashmirensis W13003 TaxID=1424334 RepID=V8QMN0_9BURK|nr:hypothetical protein [Advenella kashmirensis]ETF00563.1 hypothetical protein W822_22600 [Advenella kashmirensis W13003]
MIETEIDRTYHRASWGSIFGGMVATLAISALLSILGAGLGLSSIDIAHTDIADGMGTGALIFAALSVIISFAAGGYISGRLTTTEGCIHGFLSWAMSVLVALVLSGMLISSTVSTVTSAVGSVASATGSVISGTVSTVGKGASGAGSLVKDSFEGLNIDLGAEAQDTPNDVKNVLVESGIPELQPRYLENQMKAVRADVAEAGKKAVANPDDIDSITKVLMDKVKSRGEKLSQKIDKEKLSMAFMNVNGMSKPEADQAADEALRTRDEAVKSFQEGLNNLDKKIEEAKSKFEEAKKLALEKAEKAKDAAAKTTIWSFVSLLIAAIISSVLGHFGAISTRRRYVAVVERDIN